jgi:hypothetical protein
VEKQSKLWKVRDKRRLLLTMMETLAGGANMSFEGDLRGLKLLSVPGASEEPTAALKRNTMWPKQDFVAVPLESSMSEKIIAAIGGTVPAVVIHIQIEKDGRLEFGAYDNFDPQSIYFGGAVKDAVIESLVSQDIIRPHTKGTANSD